MSFFALRKKFFRNTYPFLKDFCLLLKGLPVRIEGREKGGDAGGVYRVLRAILGDGYRHAGKIYS
ncbi:hypothetical protein BBR01nite_46000 [Brevibacillus brevis]|nr:hypothetical protein BBR01nite_46000 [Brevibacillus brevis]